ncbi:hypothetical protein [Streptomyces yaizuensis]|uniref:Uncharacterized protein n=1 Tax=Streptomyces yaizuensis TaxID=2989713 RepID=A0ABQ5PBD2_9ACTN|nr:hypothetical protein [Streptomyces sp. YSPA8]GLF95161.1 hypothetical protein SYYSPA8_12710 [Streptomyces sp. YSPA8]GLF99872.1 hypothetical protein SYYSPA8_36265 [Streptomyces sp. YSPA8]
MTKDRKRKPAARAEMAVTGLRRGEAGARVEARRAAPDFGAVPPAGVPMDPDPLGTGYELLTVPLIVTVMLPAGADGCGYLVSPQGWYRARARVWGPMPTRESGLAPPAGQRPGC